LLYRIHVVPVQLPALRERRSDVVALIAHFIQETNRRRNRAVTGVSEDALSVLTAYDWPGNVRQLENMVERMVLLRGSGQIAIEDVPERIVGAAQARLGSSDPLLPEDGIDLRDAVEHYENSLILKALERTGWNRSRAAEVLRMNRTTLVEKLKKKNLDQTAA
jgi:DNA-binding NtrC family response regulator